MSKNGAKKRKKKNLLVSFYRKQRKEKLKIYKDKVKERRERKKEEKERKTLMEKERQGKK